MTFPLIILIGMTLLPLESFAADHEGKKSPYASAANIESSDVTNVTNEGAEKIASSAESAKPGKLETIDIGIEQKSERKILGFMLQIGGNFGFPFGDFYDGVAPGAGFGANLIVPLSNHSALRFSTSLSGIDWEDVIKYRTILIPGSRIDVEKTRTATRVSIAGQFYNRPRINGVLQNTMTYVFLGVGYISHHLNTTTSVVDISNGTVRVSSFNDTETNLMFTFGAGHTTLIFSNIGIDFGSQLDLVINREKTLVGFETSSGGSTIQEALILDINVGLVYVF